MEIAALRSIEYASIIGEAREEPARMVLMPILHPDNRHAGRRSAAEDLSGLCR